MLNKGSLRPHCQNSHIKLNFWVLTGLCPSREKILERLITALTRYGTLWLLVQKSLWRFSNHLNNQRCQEECIWGDALASVIPTRQACRCYDILYVSICMLTGLTQPWPFEVMQTLLNTDINSQGYSLYPPRNDVSTGITLSVCLKTLSGFHRYFTDVITT